ncbi:MAG: cyclic nucleotide-binding domain-containing protein [bacterium]|nr:cyclic nucleotide-binding domain-containing protein [bacterium]
MTLTDKIAIIKHNYLFSSLSEENLHHIVLKTAEKEFGAQELLIEQDSLDTSVYFIYSGSVRIYRIKDSGEELALTVRGPGDVIGELSLFNHYRRGAMVEAIEDTRVLGLSATDFLQVLYAYPEVSITLLQVLSERIDELGRKLELLT